MTNKALSFGASARAYDSCRPRYPQALIASLVPAGGVRALDVGAGTGIASAQLRAAGAQVLAVEPDPRMGAVAAEKGIAVEQATFEQWRPEGRTFGLVVFAQSFHWVDPRAALEKVPAVLEPGGRLALLWNRITPLGPPQADMDDMYADYGLANGKPSVEDLAEILDTLNGSGFVVERRDFHDHRHYSTEEWLNLVFTYSSCLALEPGARDGLRARLAERIGPNGVDAENRGVAFVCAPRA